MGFGLGVFGNSAANSSISPFNFNENGGQDTNKLDMAIQNVNIDSPVNEACI